MWNQKTTIGETKVKGGKLITLIDPDMNVMGHHQALGNATPNLLLTDDGIFVHHGVDGFLRLVPEGESPLKALAESSARLAEKPDA